jgi:hypothetical protein
MDYSMYLKRKRHNVLTSGYTLKIADGNPMFGRDKKTRGFDNGIVTVLFEKGLSLSSSAVPKFTGTFVVSFTRTADPQDEDDAVIAAGVPLNFLFFFQDYNGGLLSFPSMPIDPITLSGIQMFMPFSYTRGNDTSGESVTYTYTGNPAADKVMYESTTSINELEGNSITLTFAFG